jgi:isomerase DpgB
MVTGPTQLSLLVDGGRPLSRESVAELTAVCDAAEDGDTGRIVLVRVSGVPRPEWYRDLSVALVSKWERALRRLERLPAVTVTVAGQDCGGIALDALLATDYRIMAPGARLVLPAGSGSTWPGMALYRLARQAASAPSARRAMMFGTPISAADAQAIGVVDEVADDATAAIAAAAQSAAAMRGDEFAIRRQLMQEALTTSFEDALGVHLAACDRALRQVSSGAA